MTNSSRDRNVFPFFSLPLTFDFREFDCRVFLSFHLNQECEEGRRRKKRKSERQTASVAEFTFFIKISILSIIIMDTFSRTKENREDFLFPWKANRRKKWRRRRFFLANFSCLQTNLILPQESHFSSSLFTCTSPCVTILLRLLGFSIRHQGTEREKNTRRMMRCLKSVSCLLCVTVACRSVVLNTPTALQLAFPLTFAIRFNKMTRAASVWVTCSFWIQMNSIHSHMQRSPQGVRDPISDPAQDHSVEPDCSCLTNDLKSQWINAPFDASFEMLLLEPEVWNLMHQMT